MDLSRILLVACVSFVLSACSPQDRPADRAEDEVSASEQEVSASEQPDIASEEVEAAEVLDEKSEAPEAADQGFAIESVPVSDAPLGDFPYFSMPEGYRDPNRPIPVLDFGRAAVWTGDRLVWVEGRIHQARVHAERGKGFSRIEVDRNIEHQIVEAGGVKVTQSRVPREIRDAWDEGQERMRGRGDIYNHPVSTYLVRRADRDIWLHFVSSTASGTWMIIESAAFEPTSALLPSSRLREELDSEGRVAVQVHFATDRAEILPGSQPQIEQITALLREDPELALSINGHTDNTGGADHNQRLSEARAQAVVAALVEAGIDDSRLAAAGFGQAHPVADNATEEGKAKNRRVELVRLQ